MAKYSVGNIITLRGDVTITGVQITKQGYPVYSTDGGFAIRESDLMRFDEGVSEAYETKPQDKPRPIKLYCIQGYADFLTRGKVYDLGEECEITYDNGFVGGGSDWNTTRILGSQKLSSYFIPLVQRPAKVGEWVYVTKVRLRYIDIVSAGQIYQIQKVYHANGFGVRGKRPTLSAGDEYWCIGLDEYLVLDGYVPEPQDNAKEREGLRDKICRIGLCSADNCRQRKNDCPLRDIQGRNDMSCDEYVRKHPETQKIMEDYLKAESAPEPKGWSGKVVCVKSDSGVFTAGRSYDFANGAIAKSDSGLPYGAESVCYPFETLEDFNRWSKFAQFIEYKGEPEPEPERPKGLNGEAICTGCPGFTTGKTYIFVDGVTIDNDGDRRPVSGGSPILSTRDPWFLASFTDFKEGVSGYEWVEGVKGFDAALRCRGDFQYKIGEKKALNEPEHLRYKGFHFCLTKQAVISNTDYDKPSSRYCKVRGLVRKDRDKSEAILCARQIEILEEITSNPVPYIEGREGQYYGEVGTTTPYKDAGGLPLVVGDVVELFGSNGVSYGNAFVVQSSADVSFIMGIKMSCDLSSVIIEGWRVVKRMSWASLSPNFTPDNGITFYRA